MKTVLCRSRHLNRLRESHLLSSLSVKQWLWFRLQQAFVQDCLPDVAVGSFYDCLRLPNHYRSSILYQIGQTWMLHTQWVSSYPLTQRPFFDVLTSRQPYYPVTITGFDRKLLNFLLMFVNALEGVPWHSLFLFRNKKKSPHSLPSLRTFSFSKLVPLFSLPSLCTLSFAIFF